MWRKVLRTWSDERGASSVEYAFLLALIGASIAAAALFLSMAIMEQINTMARSI